VRSLNEICGLRVSVDSYVSPKVTLQCKRYQPFGHTQRYCGHATRCFACGGSHLSGGCSTAGEQHPCCGCGENDTANYSGCVKWKEAKAALVKQAPEDTRKSVGHRPTCRSKSSAGRFLCRADGPGRGVESRYPRGACSQGYHESTHQPTF